MDLTRTPEKHPSGPKGPIDFAALAARLKAVPFQNLRFQSLGESGRYKRQSIYCANLVLDLITKAVTARY
jgi:hypothetical protein